MVSRNIGPESYTTIFIGKKSMVNKRKSFPVGRRTLGMTKLLSVKEVAQILQTSKPQVRKMIQLGELLAVKVGREY